MSKQLTEEEQLVWDRLLRGIPAPPEYSYLEEEITRVMSEEIAKEIDREILRNLMDLYRKI